VGGEFEEEGNSAQCSLGKHIGISINKEEKGVSGHLTIAQKESRPSGFASLSLKDIKADKDKMKLLSGGMKIAVDKDKVFEIEGKK